MTWFKKRREIKEARERRLKDASRELELAHKELDVVVRQQAQCSQCALKRLESLRPPAA